MTGRPIRSLEAEGVVRVKRARRVWIALGLVLLLGFAACGQEERSERRAMPTAVSRSPVRGASSGTVIRSPGRGASVGRPRADPWIRIPPGSFRMGSPKTEPCRDADEDRHGVTLSRGFLMASHEVTQGRFAAHLGYNPAFHAGCDDCPVEWVTWHEAVTYCNRLSAAAGRPTCYACTGAGPSVRCTPKPGAPQRCPGYRLPTEAEWEHAARAGTTAGLPCGDVSSCMCTDSRAGRLAWYKINSGGKTRRVGAKAPNSWGLYDLAGNVYEWVHDWYQPHLGHAPVRDPAGPSTGTERVLRGGSWYFNAEHLRSANRERFAPHKRFTFVGFRCVRSL